MDRPEKPDLKKALEKLAKMYIEDRLTEEKGEIARQILDMFFQPKPN